MKDSPVAWLNYPKSVQSVKTDTSMAWIKKNRSSLHTKGILDKNCVSRSTLQGLLKNESTRLKLAKSNLTIQTFLPYGRKKGLFGHIVAKSHKAWQTMELYPSWISEVHQTYPGHNISIWACRECLGHTNSKKNGVKRLFFEWVIPRTSFWLQIPLHFDWLMGLHNHYKLMGYTQMTMLWLTKSWL